MPDHKEFEKNCINDFQNKMAKKLHKEVPI